MIDQQVLLSLTFLITLTVNFDKIRAKLKNIFHKNLTATENAHC